MEEIYSRLPVNRLASIVTSQTGCASDDTLNNEQKRENLVAQVKVLQAYIKTKKRGSGERKMLGAQLLEINTRINELRPAKKNPGVESYVMDIIREEMTKFEFDRLMGRAGKRMIEDKGAVRKKISYRSLIED